MARERWQIQDLYKHPAEQQCLDDPVVLELLEHIEERDSVEWKKKELIFRDGRDDDDLYYYYDEGMMIRMPVLVKWIVDYLRSKDRLHE